MTGDDEKKGISELLKKLASTGLSAAFLTEDAVKQLKNDLPLPKDIVNNLLNHAKNSRDEFIVALKKELSARLDKVNISKEIEKIIDKYDFEVHSTIKLKKKKGKRTSR